MMNAHTLCKLHYASQDLELSAAILSQILASVLTELHFRIGKMFYTKTTSDSCKAKPSLVEVLGPGCARNVARALI